MKNYWLHLETITKHKFVVMYYCFKAGIPIRGLLHDLSKFGPLEFFTTGKYYTGTGSPIDAEKKEKGYSLGWLHHRGRNPHHWEYWMDNFSKGGQPMLMPYSYAVEMICDWIGAGKIYLGGRWTTDSPKQWFIIKVNAGDMILHPCTFDFVWGVLCVISDMGNMEVLKKGGVDLRYLYEVYTRESNRHEGRRNYDHWSPNAIDRSYFEDAEKEVIK